MKVYSKQKFIWSKERTQKLIQMKQVGHRNYRMISKSIGCSASSAQERYLKLVG